MTREVVSSNNHGEATKTSDLLSEDEPSPEDVLFWTSAAALFSVPPRSNGHDARYETVKSKLRHRFGHDAINESNKERLKDLAKSGGTWL